MEVGGRGTGRAFSPIYPRLTTVVAYSNITDHYHYYCHHYSYSPLFPKGATACSVARRTVACRPFYCIAERLRSGRTAQASGRGDPTNRSANSPKRLRLPCIQSRGHTELSFFFFFVCVIVRPPSDHGSLTRRSATGTHNTRTSSKQLRWNVADNVYHDVRFAALSRRLRVARVSLSLVLSDVVPFVLPPLGLASDLHVHSSPGVSPCKTGWSSRRSSWPPAKDRGYPR